MLLWVAMVLQLDIAPLGSGVLGFLPPFVCCDASHYEEGEVDDPGSVDSAISGWTFQWLAKGRLKTQDTEAKNVASIRRLDLQYESQKDVGSDLDLAHRVYLRLTCLGPEIESVAGDEAVELQLHRLPPP